MSLHKIKMVQHRSRVFYDRGRTWLANTNVDNIVFAVCHPLATRLIYFFDISENKWTIIIKQ